MSQLDETLLDVLRGIVGSSGVLTGEEVSSRYPGYFMDRINADAIIRPRNTAEVARILSICNERSQSVVIQGGMSGWVRGTQTRKGEIVLSLEKMAVIEEIDPINRTATVQAGVILATLQDAVAAHDLSFALDLGGRGSCQLGGNAATNAGGVRVLRYGMMRDQVLGLEAVLADGRIISSMNRMIKNNAGYDLKQLFIGSEGTLGVITRLVVRLRELPTSSNTALVAASNFRQLAGLLRHVDGALGGLLSAFELIDNSFYRVNTDNGRHIAPLPSEKPFYAIIEALGSDQARDTELFEQALNDAAQERFFDDAILARSEREREAIWALREDLEYIVQDFQPFYAFDISLPVGDMDAYMEDVTARLHRRWPDGRIAFLGHVGDGNLHVAVGAGEADERHAIEECVYEPLRHIGGSVSAEHGIGLEKKPWLSITRSLDECNLMHELKQMLDPKGILNPGKLLP